jgi:hypothetical protein
MAGYLHLIVSIHILSALPTVPRVLTPRPFRNLILTIILLQFSQSVLQLGQPRPIDPCVPLTNRSGRPDASKSQRSQPDTCKLERGLALLLEQKEIFVQK